MLISISTPKSGTALRYSAKIGKMAKKFQLARSVVVLLFFSSRGKIEKRETRSLFFEKSRLVFLENFSFYTKVKVQFWNFLLILIGNFLVLSGDSL